MLMVYDSAGSRRQIRLWSDRAPEDACSASGRTSTVLYLHHNRHLYTTNAFSYYEGHTMDVVTFATRVCKLLGVETMVGMLH